MYKIQITSNIEWNSVKSFQTEIMIKENGSDDESRLIHLLNKNSYYLNIYKNPIFWLVNISPMFVYMSKYKSNMNANNCLLIVNKQMNFSFKRRSHHKYFERIIEKVLTVFLDKLLENFSKENTTFAKNEIATEG